MTKSSSPVGQSGEVPVEQTSHETVPTKAVIVHTSSNKPKDRKNFKQTVQDVVTVLGLIKVLIEIFQLFG